MLLNQPLSIYTRDGDGTGLTKCGQEPYNVQIREDDARTYHLDQGKERLVLLFAEYTVQIRIEGSRILQWSLITIALLTHRVEEVAG
jgi:hypothetical protein